MQKNRKKGHIYVMGITYMQPYFIFISLMPRKQVELQQAQGDVP